MLRGVSDNVSSTFRHEKTENKEYNARTTASAIMPIQLKTNPSLVAANFSYLSSSEFIK